MLEAVLYMGASSCQSVTAHGSINTEAVGKVPLQTLALGVVIRRSHVLLCE